MCLEILLGNHLMVLTGLFALCPFQRLDLLTRLLAIIQLLLSDT